MATAIDRVTRDREWLGALAAGAMYTFLSRGLAHPTAEGEREIEERLLPLLGSIRLPEPCRTSLDEAIVARRIPLERLRRSHGRVFTPIESQDCPSYETAFVRGDVFRQAHTIADVGAFYRAHGLAIGGPLRVRPDHIVAELEFMGFMGRKEALAIRDERRGRESACRKAQDGFLRDHLGTWAPGFGRRLALVADDRLFASTGTVLAEWVELDLARRGIEPAERLDTPAPQPPPDDGSCGPEADGWIGAPGEGSPA